MKIVMIIDKALPSGLRANTAAVLGITLGKVCPQIVGPDCLDGAGESHRGITDTVIPVLASDAEGLKSLYKEARTREGVELIDFTQTAQRSKAYPDYTQKLAGLEPGDLEFSGLCLFGPDAEIKGLTGSLPLLR